MKSFGWFNSADLAGESHLCKIELSKSFKLLGDNGGFQLALISDINMLEIASAASTRPGKFTWSFNTVWRRLEDFDDICAGYLGDHRGNLNKNSLAWNRVAYEDHLALVAGDEVSAVGSGDDIDRYLLPYFKARTYFFIRGFVFHLPTLTELKR
jgi:hypothetical protein